MDKSDPHDYLTTVCEVEFDLETGVTNQMSILVFFSVQSTKAFSLPTRLSGQKSGYKFEKKYNFFSSLVDNPPS